MIATILITVSNMGNAVACWLMNVPVEKVVIFFGKPVVKFPTRLAPVHIGFIPLGGYVQMDMREFPKKPVGTRCLVLLAGPVSTFVAAILCLGFSHPVTSFVSAYPQFFEAIWSPLFYVKPLIAGYLGHAATSPVAGCGILAAKIAALNFLPMPTTPGGQFLMQFGNGMGRVVVVLGNLLASAVLLSLAAGLAGHFLYKH